MGSTTGNPKETPVPHPAGPMTHRDDLVNHLDGYLDVERFDDRTPNGLQVEGREHVEHVVTGVSACMPLFRKALQEDADLVLVHHGMFWGSEPTAIVGPKADRVRFLLEHDLNLVQYHLPLDAHAEVGNNFVAARELGLTDLEPWAEHDGVPIGVRGRFPESKLPDEVFEALEDLYRREPLVFAHGPDEVEHVGIVSGAAQGELVQATRDGLDLFVTGEVSEWNPRHAQAHGIHFASCGHHATERLGVQRLGAYVEDRFGLDHTFIDIPNPV